MPGLFSRLIDSILLPTNKNGPFTGPFFLWLEPNCDEACLTWLALGAALPGLIVMDEVS